MVDKALGRTHTASAADFQMIEGDMTQSLPKRERRRVNKALAADKASIGARPNRPTALTLTPSDEISELQTLRALTMRLTWYLERLIPLDDPEADPSGDYTAASVGPASGNDGSTAKPGGPGVIAAGLLSAAQRDATTTDGRLAAFYERLLGRQQSVINGFATLARLQIALSRRESEARDRVQTPESASLKLDGQELDRRITAELDRIAARKRSAGGGEQCLPE